MIKQALQIVCRAVVAIMAALAVQRLDAQVFTAEATAPDRIFLILDEPPSDAVLLLAQRERTSGSQATPDYAAPQSRDRDGGSDGSNDRLIDRVVDPVSWLMQFRFRESWTWPTDVSQPDGQKFEF